MRIPTFSAIARSAAVGMNAVLPLARLIGLRSSMAVFVVINTVSVMFFVVVILVIAMTSPFPTDPIVHSVDGAMVWSSSITRVVLGSWLRLLACAVFMAVVVIAFVFDLVDAAGGDTSRFRYDDEKSSSRTIAWSLVLLLIGYMFRLWLFGIVATVSLREANTISVITTGEGIFSPADASALGGARETVNIALAKPLADYETKSSRNVPIQLFVIFTGMSRLIIGAMLLGTFHLLMPAIGLSHASRTK